MLLYMTSLVSDLVSGGSYITYCCLTNKQPYHVQFVQLSKSTLSAIQILV